MYYFGDIMYAMGMNLMKSVCVKYGQQDDTEKKFCKFDEVVKLINEAVKEPDHTGNFHDYIELCKLYDKNENGTIMVAELETFLTLMGKYNFQLTHLTHVNLEVWNRFSTKICPKYYQNSITYITQPKYISLHSMATANLKKS